MLNGCQLAVFVRSLENRSTEATPAERDWLSRLQAFFFRCVLSLANSILLFTKLGNGGWLSRQGIGRSYPDSDFSCLFLQ